MYVLCLHDELKRLPIGKWSSRSTLPSSLLISPTHMHLYSYEYQHANACSLTQACTHKHMYVHPHEHEHIHTCKNYQKKEMGTHFHPGDSLVTKLCSCDRCHEDLRRNWLPPSAALSFSKTKRRPRELKICY